MRKLLLLLVLAAAAPDSVAAQEDVRVLGEVRLRPEAERPATTESFDALTLLRARLGVLASLSERAHVFVQAQDARTFGEEASTTDGTADRLDVHQAWLQYGRTIGSGHAWSVRAGRQEIMLGNERLVGAVGWSNTGRSFDGARLTFGSSAADAWSVSVIAATVQERGTRFTGTETDEDDHLLLGAFAELNPIQLFVLHDREAAYRNATGVDRTTIGARVAASTVSGFTASVEGAWQFGNQLLNAPALVSQDISAYLAGARLEYATSLTAMPRLGLGIDYLSGDETPFDDEYGAFNTLYATNHKFYGFIDFFLDPAARTQDRGLVDGIASLSLGLPRELRLDLDGHAFWTQQPLSADAERLIGYELDVTLPVRLGPGQQLQLGYSAFRNGPAAPFIGLGRERGWSHWAYLQATFSFGGALTPIL